MNTLGAKFKTVADAIAQGKDDEALEGLLWIHDNPNTIDPSSEMFRRAYGFMALAVLAKKYSPAAAALADLVQKKRDRVSAGLADESTKADLRALEAALLAMGP